jgi:hypothetical protein
MTFWLTAIVLIHTESAIGERLSEEAIAQNTSVFKAHTWPPPRFQLLAWVLRQKQKGPPRQCRAGQQVRV